jgi:hypothetical protein
MQRLGGFTYVNGAHCVKIWSWRVIDQVVVKLLLPNNSASDQTKYFYPVITVVVVLVFN